MVLGLDGRSERERLTDDDDATAVVPIAPELGFDVAIEVSALAGTGQQDRVGAVERAAAAACGDAYELAYATDPTSAFGGIIAVNRPLDAATAKAST